MRASVLSRIGVVCTVALLGAGCKKPDTSKLEYTRTLNAWHAVDPACVWQTDVRLPVQINTSDADKVRPYDALFDAGLLTRTATEKRMLILGSRQVSIYDLSPAGRATWTADVKNPGFGNFCYGWPHVVSIDSATLETDKTFGPAMEVSYHTAVPDLPAWTRSVEVQNAFPLLSLDAKGPRPESATLVRQTGGWSVAAGPVRRTPVVRNSDGSIVE